VVTAPLAGPTLWLTERAVVRRLVTEHPIGRRVAGRFVAGDTLEEGMAAAKALSERGIASMLNHLGENVSSAAQAAEATDGYIRALKRIQESPEIDCNISVKLTQLGLDASMDGCAENLERVLQAAHTPDRSTQVMIDMESREYVDRTIQVYLALRDTYPSFGVCLQTYLYRTAADAHRIAGHQAIVRVVKGAYLEPADAAHQSRREVRRNFARVSATLLSAGSAIHVATHDPVLLDGARRFIRTRSISNTRYEFQFLYGIRRDLQASLVAAGEPIRVFIPYGTEWYPYLTRRLAERPANVWFFLSNLMRRGG